MLQPTVKPFLRWAGSKRQLLPQLVPYWGCGHKRYIEPFMGSASLFFALQPNNAVLGDINAELVNAFCAIRDHLDEVYNTLMQIPSGKTSYYKLRATDTKQLNPMERAARFIFLNRFCFNGLYRTNNSGHFNVPFSPSGTGNLPTWENFSACSVALKNAELHPLDFEELVRKKVKKNDFVYLDPPYAVANQRIFSQYDPQTFGLTDIERLADIVKEINNRGAYFILSYAFDEEVSKKFQEWHIRKVYTQRNISGFSKHRRVAPEMIITNISILPSSINGHTGKTQ